MRIVCIGGGPAGLYFALLMKKLDPAHRITVVERNKPYDTFGWGVVFSDATMENMRRWDPESCDQIEQSFSHWDDIELRFKGRRIRSGGHGFVGIGRKHLLNILQARCEALGVELLFETEVDSDLDYPDADLIIASDGINSKIRTAYADVFRPDIVTRPNRFIWLGTHKLFDAFTFDFQRTEHGWFQAHIYKFDANTTTFIVECPESVWQAHGLDNADQHGVAQLPANRVRAVVAAQPAWQPCRTHGRCGAYGAFRHRIGHQAGARGCDRAGPAISAYG